MWCARRLSVSAAAPARGVSCVPHVMARAISCGVTTGALRERPTGVRPQLQLAAPYSATAAPAAAAAAAPGGADTTGILASDPYSLVELMRQNDIWRGFLLTNRDGDVKASHEADDIDFLAHEAVFFEISPRTGALMGAFLWWTNRGQGCGGIRLREFRTTQEWLRDGIRLATGMGRKAALAGLWWGGGKGVIAQPPGDQHLDPVYRRELMEDYGRFLTGLRGCYVAAEDSGINVEDVDIVFEQTRFTTCISPHLGGSGNPSVPTAAGVVCAMEAAVDHLGLGDLSGKSVAIQGIGNVGLPLVEFLLERDVGRIVVSEALEGRLNIAKALVTPDRRVEMRLASSDDDSILFEDVDIVAPCAFGGVLSPATIPKIKAKIVCGASNNQLLHPNDDELLEQAGILYVPDLVANRMGIVNCANEQYGRVGYLEAMEDPEVVKHLGRDDHNSVFNVTKRVLRRAESEGTTTARAANAIADEMAVQPHPIFPHRALAIRNSLVADGWHREAMPGSSMDLDDEGSSLS